MELARPGEWEGVAGVDFEEAVRGRESRRSFSRRSLLLDELSFLLWATQGVREVVNPACVLRTVPSAGARHALETYCCVFRVEGLDAGIWRYLPLEHALVFESGEKNLAGRLSRAALGQGFVADAAVVVVWTAVLPRCTWKYGPRALRYLGLDLGHAAQNLILAAEALGLHGCPVAAFLDRELNRVLEVDGEEEFAYYLAAIGPPAGPATR